MHCEELDHLRRQHRDALDAFGDAGGYDKRRVYDPELVAANAKILDTVEAIIQHRQEHGCSPLALTEEQVETLISGSPI